MSVSSLKIEKFLSQSWETVNSFKTSWKKELRLIIYKNWKIVISTLWNCEFYKGIVASKNTKRCQTAKIDYENVEIIKSTL